MLTPASVHARWVEFSWVGWCCKSEVKWNNFGLVWPCLGVECQGQCSAAEVKPVFWLGHGQNVRPRLRTLLRGQSISAYRSVPWHLDQCVASAEAIISKADSNVTKCLSNSRLRTLSQKFREYWLWSSDIKVFLGHITMQSIRCGMLHGLFVCLSIGLGVWTQIGRGRSNFEDISWPIVMYREYVRHTVDVLTIFSSGLQRYCLFLSVCRDFFWHFN